MLEGDGRTDRAASEEETKPERISVMTLAGEDGGGGEGGGRRRRAAASRVCFHVVSSQIRRNEMRVRQTSGGRTTRWRRQRRGVNFLVALTESELAWYHRLGEGFKLKLSSVRLLLVLVDPLFLLNEGYA